jgi:pimeloyl-ACP methyl ester carboxylesterase
VLAEPAFLDPAGAGAFGTGRWPGLRVVWGVARAWVGKWFVQTRGDPYARDDYFLLQLLPLMQGEDELCDGKLPPLQAWRFGSPNFQATIGRMMAEPEFAASLDFRRGAQAFRGEVLFLAGECNRGGAAQQGKHLRFFANASLAVVPRAGHFMFNDQPDHSMSIVRTFLGALRDATVRR